MPLLIVLGLIVLGIAVAIFRFNKVQSDRFIEAVKNAKPADEATDTGNDNDAADTSDEGESGKSGGGDGTK